MKRRWHKERDSHIDDWLMTYADVITLLLCLFAVLLSASVPRQDPTQKAEVAARIVLPIEPMDVPPGPHPLRGVDGAADKAIVEEAPKRAANESARPMVAADARVVPPPELAAAAKPEPAARIDGDRISTIELDSAAFFASGAALLSKEGEAILRDVALRLKAAALQDYRITVEGHTDDSPIKTVQFPSNWELSTARAAAVLHFLLDQGIAAQRLRAAGYADTFPKAPNRDGNGTPIPGNQAQNRRVVIRLEKIEKADPAAAALAGSTLR
jgi:chemotaxis protein MotB